MNPSNAWKGKLEAASFVTSKSLARQCEHNAQFSKAHPKLRKSPNAGVDQSVTTKSVRQKIKKDVV